MKEKRLLRRTFGLLVFFLAFPGFAQGVESSVSDEERKAFLMGYKDLTLRDNYRKELNLLNCITNVKPFRDSVYPEVRDLVVEKLPDTDAEEMKELFEESRKALENVPANDFTSSTNHRKILELLGTINSNLDKCTSLLGSLRRATELFQSPGGGFLQNPQEQARSTIDRVREELSFDPDSIRTAIDELKGVGDNG